MKRPRWYVIVLIVWVAWLLLVPLVVQSATYHGKVVDEETGEPIANAVVAVIWYKSPIIQMEGTRSFQAAQETVTNSDGSFSLWTSPGYDFNPFTYVRTPPTVVIFKAGYSPLAHGTAYNRGFKSEEELDEALKNGATIKLPKFKAQEKATNFTDVGSLSVIDARSDRLPKLFEEVNAHRRALGIMSPVY